MISNVLIVHFAISYDFQYMTSFEGSVGWGEVGGGEKVIRGFVQAQHHLDTVQI